MVGYLVRCEKNGICVKYDKSDKNTPCSSSGYYHHWAQKVKKGDGRM